jgi:hypothetical protein
MDSTSSKEDVSFDPFFDEDADANEFAMRRTPFLRAPRAVRSIPAHSRNWWKRKRARRR